MTSPSDTARTLWGAIEEFAKPEDLPSSSGQVYRFDQPGVKAVSFRRGDFQPSADKVNPISLALRNCELGSEQELEEIKRRLREELGIEIELRYDPIREVGVSMIITELILTSTGDIWGMFRLACDDVV